MKTFQEAARAALTQLYAGEATPGAGVDRLSVDVELDGRSETVSLRLRGAELSWSCTCAQPECRHARVALTFLAGAEGDREDRITEVWDQPVVGGSSPGAERRRLAQDDAAADVDRAALAEVLEDLLQAVVRAGVGVGASAALDDALQRLPRAAPSPLPLAVSRWIGRLKRALAAHDSDDVARLLAGASLLIDDLHVRPASSSARQRIRSWLGTLDDDADGIARLTDRTLIEVVREPLTGVERAAVERRYLVDLSDGAIYREDRPPGAATASIGPCPRVVTVWLAIAEQGAAPQRLRLLQYAVSPAIEPLIWEQLAGCAVRDWNALLATYRGAARAYPGLCEPFALVAPAKLVHDLSPVLIDHAGRSLHLVHPDNPPALRYLEAFTAGETAPAWVAGRMFDRDGVLAMAPLAVGMMRDGQLRYAQL
jgi:hypothetical protein